MPDQKFTFTSIPEGYSARLQRGAVLHRLVGRCGSGQEIVTGTEHVVTMWRARLHALRQLGWQPKWTAADWQFMRNCRPAFAVVHPATRRCNLSYICPFCYARRLYTVWSRLAEVCGWPVHTDDAATSSVEASARPALHLLVRTFTKEIDLSVAAADKAAVELLADRMRKVLSMRLSCISTLRPRGAFTFTDFVPTTDGFRMEYRELHLVDATYVLASEVAGVVARVEDPTRAELARAVAAHCAYPTELLFGPVDRLKVALDARAGLRLFTTYGILRQHRR